MMRNRHNDFPGGNSFTETGFSEGSIREVSTSSGKRYVTVYYIKDHLGSVRTVLERSDGGTGDGNFALSIVGTHNYLPFGKRWSDPNSQQDTERYRFNGKFEEQNWKWSSGLLDYGARHYDPTLARWMSIDPLGDLYPGVGGYVYCLNAPMRYTDPTGMIVLDGIEGFQKIGTGIERYGQVAERGWAQHRNEVGRMGAFWAGASEHMLQEYLIDYYTAAIEAILGGPMPANMQISINNQLSGSMGLLWPKTPDGIYTIEINHKAIAQRGYFKNGYDDVSHMLEHEIFHFQLWTEVWGYEKALQTPLEAHEFMAYELSIHHSRFWDNVSEEYRKHTQEAYNSAMNAFYIERIKQASGWYNK